MTVFLANNAFAYAKTSVTIAINKTTYPYQFENAKGEADGLVVDLWKLWAEKQNVNVEFKLLSWQQTLTQVANGTVDIHAGMSQLEKRHQAFDFAPAFFTLSSFIYVNAALDNVHQISDLKPYVVASVAESSHITTLSKTYPFINIKRFKSRHDVYQAALRGNILAFTDIEHFKGGFKGFKGLVELFPTRKRLFLDDIVYGAAVKKGNTELLDLINQGLVKIKFSEQAAIERKWLGVEKERSALLLAFSTNLSPYMGISPTGKPQGLFVDLWRLWSKTTGQEIEFMPAEMSTALKFVKQQKADVHIAYPESALVNTGLRQAWKLYQVKSRVFVLSKFQQIQKMTDLAGKTVGVFSTAPYKVSLAKQYPDIHYQYFNSLDEMLEAAELEQVVAIIGSEDNLTTRFLQTNMQSLFKPLKTPLFYSDIYSIVSPENKALAEIIKDGFEQIPNSELLAVERKWLPNKTNYYFDQSNAKVELSSSEKKWRANHNHIKVGYTKNWAPIEFVDSQGQLQGINSDIYSLIENNTDLLFEYQGFDSWASLSQALANKTVDIAGGVALTPERLTKFSFTQSYWQMPWVILHRQSAGSLDSFANLTGKRLAIVKGYELAHKITKQYPLIQLITVDTPEQGLRAVQQNLADGLIEPLATASELLKKESLVNLTLSIVDELQHDDEQTQNHIMVRKDWPELVSILNKGLAKITPEQKQQIYEKWSNVKVKSGYDKSMIMRLAAQVTIIVLIFLLFILWWNRRLYKEIKARKALEEKMKHMATHDELTGLANRGLLKERLNNMIALHQRQNQKLAVLFVDLDGFKIINDTYGHNVGDELLVQLAKRLKKCVRQSDTLVRFGGDEFVVLVTNLNQPQEASFIAEKILTAIKAPFELSVVTTCIGCSIGIAVYPDDGETDTELVKVADTLMYSVKERGKNNFTFSH